MSWLLWHLGPPVSEPTLSLVHSLGRPGSPCCRRHLHPSGPLRLRACRRRGCARRPPAPARPPRAPRPSTPSRPSTTSSRPIYSESMCSTTNFLTRRTSSSARSDYGSTLKNPCCCLANSTNSTSLPYSSFIYLVSEDVMLYRDDEHRRHRHGLEARCLQPGQVDPWLRRRGSSSAATGMRNW